MLFLLKCKALLGLHAQEQLMKHLLTKADANGPKKMFWGI